MHTFCCSVGTTPKWYGHSGLACKEAKRSWALWNLHTGSSQIQNAEFCAFKTGAASVHLERNNLFCVSSYLGTSDICNLGMLEVRRRRLHLDCRVCSFGALHRSESCAAKCGNLFVGWIFEPPCWTAVRKPGPVLHASRCRAIWWEMHVPFGSPFSSVSSPIFVSKFSFCSIHQDLQDWRTFAPLQSEHVRNILTNICHLL